MPTCCMRQGKQRECRSTWSTSSGLAPTHTSTKRKASQPRSGNRCKKQSLWRSSVQNLHRNMLRGSKSRHCVRFSSWRMNASLNAACLVQRMVKMKAEEPLNALKAGRALNCTEQKRRRLSSMLSQPSWGWLLAVCLRPCLQPPPTLCHPEQTCQLASHQR